ncbi:MAG: BTAD domain-containing putative transcriptional regulator [Chloroflexota bacterium]
MTDMITIKLLGPPIISRQGQVVKPDTNKSIALLAYLILTPNYIDSREKIAALLWPNYSQSRAKANLRRTLSALIKVVGREKFITNRDTIQLLTNHVVCDVIQLTRCLENYKNEKSWLTQAIALTNEVQGEFLSGFLMQDNNEFEGWLGQVRNQFVQIFNTLFRRIISTYEQNQMWDEAITVAQNWIRQNGSSEEAHNQLIRLYAKSNLKFEAMKQYARCVEQLRQDLDLPPSLDIQKFAAQLNTHLDSMKHLDDLSQENGQPIFFVGQTQDLGSLERLFNRKDTNIFVFST